MSLLGFVGPFVVGVFLVFGVVLLGLVVVSDFGDCLADDQLRYVDFVLEQIAH